METTLLKREAIAWDTIAEHEEFLTENLDIDAKTELGYDRLLEERTMNRQRKSLQQTFVDLDIRPFTDSSVKAYKESCEWKANPRMATANIIGVAITMLVSLFALIVLVFSALLGLASMAFYSAIVFLVNTTAAVVGCLIDSRITRERKWAMHELSSFDEPIPEFVLQTAVDIKKSHPDAEFYVCTLEEDQVVVDPFLVLRTSFGDEVHDYYLEVWNESKFNGHREA